MGRKRRSRKLRRNMMLIALAAAVIIFVGVTDKYGIIDWNALIREARDTAAQASKPIRENAVTVADAAPAISIPSRRMEPNTPPPPDWLPEVHCKHFFYGYPSGTPSSNDLIIRDIYALSNNDERKFADWVAYRLDEDTVDGGADTEREWEADPWLEEEETLEPDDYRGAHAELNTDRGHQAPLASFRGTKKWADTNYLSNITPQRSELNQGPWRILEEKVPDLAEDHDGPVYVITGPLYERDMQSMPGADEEHEVPSGYWKIICIEDEPGGYDSIHCAAFLFDQETPRGAHFIDYLTTIDEIETRSGLDFLRDLPDGAEESIERRLQRAWAEQAL